MEVMKRFRVAVRRKGPEGRKNRPWMLRHDNAPAQTSLIIREFLAKHEKTVVAQPPWYPYLAPATRVFVPEFEIHSEMSPISDDRRDRRNIATGPTRYLVKRVPGRIPELGGTLGALNKQWRGVLWRIQVL
jgi:hypothetical protein